MSIDYIFENIPPLKPRAEALGIKLVRRRAMAGGVAGVLNIEEDGGYTLFINGNCNIGFQRMVAARGIVDVGRGLPTNDGVIEYGVLLQRLGVEDSLDYRESANQEALCLLTPDDLMQAALKLPHFTDRERAELLKVTPSNFERRLMILNRQEVAS